MKICPSCAEAYPDDSEICGHDGTPLRQEVDSLLGKTVAQRYRLISRVGAGRVSIVYLARHVMIDRLSAIKILRPNLVRNAALCERFLREARAVNRINHDNIVEISDYGEANGIVYLVMEYVPGETMRKRMSTALFSWPRAVSVGIQLASALGRAHQMGIVHRDVNPNSILLVKRKDGRETVKLIDFGVAKMVDGPTASAGMSLPGYAAPETIQSGRSDPQSDLYSLGAVLYEAMSGVVPSGATPSGRPVAGAGSLPPLDLGERVPHLPEALARVVMQLLAPRPEYRQRDAFLLLDELTAIQRDNAEPLSKVGPPTSQQADARPVVISTKMETPPDTLRAGPTSSSPQPSTVTGAMKALVEPAPAPSVREYRPPDTGSRPLSELEPLCREALSKVERAVAGYAVRPPLAEGLLAEVRRLIDLVMHASQAVVTDQAEIGALEAKSHEAKGNFGRALDELGHDLSRANALVADLDGRIAKLKEQRESDPKAKGGQRDAWMWEQGAMAEEVGRGRAWATDLAFQLSELRKRLDAQVGRMDGETARARAVLEGHVAGLRTLARETWGAIEQAAEQLGVPMTLVGPET
jgi:serine/threonine protein kinase